MMNPMMVPLFLLVSMNHDFIYCLFIVFLWQLLSSVSVHIHAHTDCQVFFDWWIPGCFLAAVFFGYWIHTCSLLILGLPGMTWTKKKRGREGGRRKALLLKNQTLFQQSMIFIKPKYEEKTRSVAVLPYKQLNDNPFDLLIIKEISVSILSEVTHCYISSSSLWY